MSGSVGKTERNIFVRTVLSWGRDNRRHFPWRETKDAFRILISELLLQRSRSTSVAKIYPILFKKWPDAHSLAKAKVSTIESVIRPLGLVKRAAVIKKLAQEIDSRGRVPDSVEELDELPGVGRYVAAATVSAAFGIPEPVVDGVTVRVYKRFFGLKGADSKEVNDDIWRTVAEVTSKKNVHEMNWAVLDFASTICMPKKPRCDDCPLKRHCAYVSKPRPMRVVELFAGVGGFRLGLAKSGWGTVLSNQWEPTTSRQHASECYVSHFGPAGHVCEDIKRYLDKVEAGEAILPDHELVVGGFPCQDYSVARVLSHAVGIVGKKGVLWWEIYRLLSLKHPPLVFLENVDRLLKSPAYQRGRDFAIMLACLSDLGYLVEWRMVNAADYGFPQKRRRVFIVGRLLRGDEMPNNPIDYLLKDGVLAQALPVVQNNPQTSLNQLGKAVPDFKIDGGISHVSNIFGKGGKISPFRNAGVMFSRDVWTMDVMANYDGPRTSLGDILQDEDEIDESYLIPDDQLPIWKYLKGSKNERRVHRASGTEYFYTEGAIPFPDVTDGPSRTILTGEGGSSPSRFKHIIRASNGRYRRLTPVELERLNGFPDGWTDKGIPDTKRAFLMGNALVVGVVERIGKVLADVLDGTLSKR